MCCNLAMTSLGDALLDDPATLKAMVLAERARADRLARIVAEMQRHRFGRALVLNCRQARRSNPPAAPVLAGRGRLCG